MLKAYSFYVGPIILRAVAIILSNNMQKTCMSYYYKKLFMKNFKNHYNSFGIEIPRFATLLQKSNHLYLLTCLPSFGEVTLPSPF